MRKVGFGLIAALFLAGCGSDGEYYEKSPDAIATAISNAELSPMIGGDVSDKSISRPDKNTVTITAHDDFGGDVFKITSKLTPDGSGTRVQTEFKLLHKKKGHDQYMAQKMATEHVAAAIEGRSPDIMAAAHPMARAIVNSNPEMKKTINQGLDAAMAMERAEQQSEFDEEYGDDWGASSENYEDGWGD